MKETKYRAMIGYLSFFGCISMPTASIPLYMTDCQPSVVIIWNSVTIALMTLSKLISLLNQLPPSLSQSSLVTISRVYS